MAVPSRNLLTGSSNSLDNPPQIHLSLNFLDMLLWIKFMVEPFSTGSLKLNLSHPRNPFSSGSMEVPSYTGIANKTNQKKNFFFFFLNYFINFFMADYLLVYFWVLIAFLKALDVHQLDMAQHQSWVLLEWLKMEPVWPSMTTPGIKVLFCLLTLWIAKLLSHTTLKTWFTSSRQEKEIPSSHINFFMTLLCRSKFTIFGVSSWCWILIYQWILWYH